MEVVIEKKLFMTVDIDVPENVTNEYLSNEIKKIIDESSEYDWEETDWRGKEVYSAYETYGGTDIELEF